MSTHALLKAAVFGTPGFAYGVVADSLEGSDDVSVTLVASGTLESVAATTTTRSASEIRARTVSGSEALSGIGTFVGCYVCLPRPTVAAGFVWDYGIVTAYVWNPSTEAGTLSVTFVKDAPVVSFDPSAFQLPAAETYLLAPCRDQMVLNVMHGEMCAINTAVYELFNGVGRSASRHPRAAFQTAGLEHPPETGVSALYDPSASRVKMVATKYALDFLYYKSGRRRVPKTVRLGDSLFDEASAAGPQPVAVESMRLRSADTQPDGGPSDSADSSDSDVVLLPKRRRQDSARGTEPSRRGTARVSAARPGDSSAAALAADLDALIASHGRDAVGAEQRAQFRPTAVQVSIHQVLSNGKSPSAHPQVLLESLQAYVDTLRFFVHPAVLRGLYGWDFGLRGLSVRHFARLTDDQLEAAAGTYDMIDFSHKNKLPPFVAPSSINALVQCVDCLVSASVRLFRQEVTDLLLAARAFMLQLEASALLRTPAAVKRLAHWLDKRFEAFRSLVAEDRWDDAVRVYLSFDTAHASFSQLQHTLTEERLQSLQATLQNARPAPAASSVPPSSTTRPTSQSRPPPVPPAVLALLPVEGGKTLCMRFLSRNVCRGRNGGCFVEDRGHFVPSSLPKLVKDHIREKLGGLRADVAHL